MKNLKNTVFTGIFAAALLFSLPVLAQETTGNGGTLVIKEDKRDQRIENSIARSTDAARRKAIRDWQTANGGEDEVESKPIKLTYDKYGRLTKSSREQVQSIGDTEDTDAYARDNAEALFKWKGMSNDQKSYALGEAKKKWNQLTKAEQAQIKAFVAYEKQQAKYNKVDENGCIKMPTTFGGPKKPILVYKGDGEIDKGVTMVDPHKVISADPDKYGLDEQIIKHKPRFNGIDAGGIVPDGRTNYKPMKPMPPVSNGRSDGSAGYWAGETVYKPYAPAERGDGQTTSYSYSAFGPGGVKK